MNKRGLVLIILLTALVAAALFASYMWWSQSVKTEETEQVSQLITVQGEIVCLPHRDTSGPQTLECAIGLKADSGSYYKIETDGDIYSFSTGSRVSVTGNIKSPEEGDIYNIEGILESSSVKLLDNDESETTEKEDNFCGVSSYGSCVTESDCVKGGCSGQICGSRNDEPLMTTCEYKECYDAVKYEKNCGCVSGKCQWSPAAKIIENDIRPIGGDRDEHGCLPAAGYSWCDAKQKCLRVWEESCPGL
ncbi:MAG: eight-cysteine-cluster domain-containing protein [Candidatus Colwellbacteria bacterium]|nr:eight-cysteine-cluster domain-containing protein [Candidatus Colwellbacteria bacterium]